MITLNEFWNSPKRYAIHCKTEEEAIILLKAFDKLGKEWCYGGSYLKRNEWGGYKKETCYSNEGLYCSKKFYLDENYTVYEFEEVDLQLIREKTCIVYNNSVLTFDGNIKLSDIQNCSIEQGTDEVVDSILVHTIYVKEN